MERNYDWIKDFIERCERRVMLDILTKEMGVITPAVDCYDEFKILPPQDPRNVNLKPLLHLERHIGWLQYSVHYDEQTLQNNLNIQFIPKN